MRGRPEHHKHLAAYGIAIIVTAFIATLWSVSLVHTIKAPRANADGSVIGKSIDEFKKTLSQVDLFDSK